ncbi:MAG: hypothetical protein IT204_18385 [Fimbriimonadaceae bacterium]|nr:hypothetical protein [Fimbriimonadaceae bacterium]
MPAAESPSANPTAGWRWLIAPLLCGTLGIVGIALAVRFTELLIGRYLAGGVPPVSAFALLLLLLALQPLLGRISPRLRMSRQQLLLAYLMQCLGSLLCGCYLVRAWLPHLVALRYWEPKKPELTGYSELLPRWTGPIRDEAVRYFYEGTHQVGGTPWADWLRPLVMWSIFFAALATAMYSLMVLVQKQWIRNERLTFPVVYLPLTLTDTDAQGPASQLGRKWLFWAGIGVAVVYNGLNIAHAVAPVVPAPGFSTPLAPYFQNKPWTPFATVTFYYMLEAIGFGYFIPLEVTFTVWFTYLLVKLFACGGVALGYERPGFPFIHEQCAGAYLACAAFVLWGLRHHLADLWRRAWRLGEAVEGERRAWIGCFAGLAGMLWFMLFTGVPLPVAALFLVILLLFVLVYTRIRAETGAPLEFTYPYWKIKELVTWTFTPGEIVSMGTMRGAISFSLFSWLSRHHFAKGVAAYDIDALKLADTVHLPRRALLLALGVAFVVGLSASVWAHLDAYYDVGCNLASGSQGRSEYRATVALEEFTRLATDLTKPTTRPWDRLSFVGGGFGVAFLLAVCRSRFPGWPLHPLGYVLATSYGDHNTAIFPMFAAWLARALIQRFGGLRAYRQGIPFFLGLIAGHFFTAGVFWPILGTYLGPDTAKAYHLFFGG